MQMENKRIACLAKVYLFSSLCISNVKRGEAKTLPALFSFSDQFAEPSTRDKNNL